MKNQKINFSYFFFVAILFIVEVFCSARSANAEIVSTPYAWVPNVSSGSVSKINTATNAVATTISVNSSPQGVAVDSSGYIWVTNYNSNNVSKIDASTSAVVATITVGNHPMGVALDSSGYVWVTNSGDGKVSKIDPANNSVLKTIPVGGSTPSVIAADSAGFIWVSNAGSNSVSKIDTSTDTVEATITVGTAPKCIAIDSSGFVWVANGMGNMSKINPSTNLVIASVNPGVGAYGVAVDPNGFIWATVYGANNVVKIDPSTNAVVATIGSFSGPAGVAADVSGNVWVVNSSNGTVSKVNSTSNEITSTINVGTTPYAWGDFTGFAYQYIVQELPLTLALSGAPTIISGTPAKFGVELAASAGTLSPTTNLTYTWYRSADNSYDGGDVSLGAGTTYTPVSADIGKYIIVRVSSADASGTASVVTNSTVINASSFASVNTSGGNASLTAPDGFASNNVTLDISKINSSSAPTPLAGFSLVGDNYFALLATDDEDNSVDTFDQPITFTISYGSDVEAQYAESTLDVYKNDSDAWEKKNCTLDTAANTLTCSLSSFSDYAVLGEPIPSEDSDDSDEVQKAKITSWSAYQYTDLTSGPCQQKIKLTIKGKYFGSDTEVKIGEKKASSVEKISSQKITAKFCLAKLQKDYLSGTNKTISVKNPHTSWVKAKKKIDLYNLNQDLDDNNNFDPTTTEGIKNIQHTLIKLKYLDAQLVTGIYGPLTTDAVQRFQADNGLPKTGYVGPLTKTKLEEKVK